MGTLACVLVAVSVAAPSDTTFTVERGERLVLADLVGDVVVTVREGRAVRLVDAEEPGARLAVRRTDAGPVFSGRSRDGSFRVEVPGWLPVEIRGRDVDVDVRGLGGGLTVRTVSGDVRLAGVSGDIRVRSVDGDVIAEDVEGTIVLTSVDDDILVRGARGRLVASTTDGDVILEAIDVERLEAVTTDGDVHFSGALQAGGRYQLATHSGDIEVTIPRNTDARVDVSTFTGAFEPAFPVVLEGIRSGRRTSFTLGSGGTGDAVDPGLASMSLEAFDGDIVLRHPGARP